jgi:long-chain acyl-CoA synthetase
MDEKHASVYSERLSRLYSEFADSPVVQFGGAWFSWGDFGTLDSSLRAELDQAGVRHEAPVAIIAGQRPECLAAILAALHQGRCAVLLSPLQADAALAEEILLLRPEVLVASADDWGRAGVTEAATDVGSVSLELTNTMEAPLARRTGPGPFRADAPADFADGTAITVLTSGTTGPPKRLPVSWATLGEMGGAENPRDPTEGVGAVILSLPLFSLGGLASIARTVFGGRPLAMMERFDLWEWAALVREHRPRVMGAPPPVLTMILEEEIPAEYFEGVKAFATDSAPVAPEVSAEFEQRYGIPVLLGYGATEFLGPVTTSSLKMHEEFGDAKRGSVGRALRGVELRVVDEDSGELLETDEVGLLQVDPPRRAGGLPEGWLPTADRARIDADGFVWILGRADDVILRGGFKVHTGEVESVLCEHPQVEDACVVGLPDSRLGSVPAAAVKVAGDSSVSGDALRDWVRDRLPPYSVPVLVEVVDEIPATSTMKKHRAAVGELLASRLSPG